MTRNLGMLSASLLAASVGCREPARAPEASAPATSDAPSPAATPSATVSLVASSAPSAAAPAEKPLIAVARLLTPAPNAERRIRLTALRSVDGSLELTLEAKESEDFSDFLRRLASTPDIHDERITATQRRNDLKPPRVTARVTARVADPTRIDIPSPDHADIDFGTGIANPFAPLSESAGGEGHSIADEVPFSDLKLVAIVHTADSIAMLSDTSGTGWTARPGDLVGRTDAPSDPNPDACRWRLERIDTSRVTFVRGTPTACAATPKTRSLDLKP
jgi:hypothetical protein